MSIIQYKTCITVQNSFSFILFAMFSVLHVKHYIFDRIRYFFLAPEFHKDSRHITWDWNATVHPSIVLSIAPVPTQSIDKHGCNHVLSSLIITLVQYQYNRNSSMISHHITYYYRLIKYRCYTSNTHEETCKHRPMSWVR